MIDSIDNDNLIIEKQSQGKNFELDFEKDITIEIL